MVNRAVLSSGGVDRSFRRYAMIPRENYNTVMRLLPESGLTFNQAVSAFQGAGFTHSMLSPMEVSLEEGARASDEYGNNNQRLDPEDYRILLRTKRLYIEG